MKYIWYLTLSLLVAVPARAELVRFNFAGVVAGLSGSDESLNSYFGLPAAPDFSGGDVTISGFFEYETDLLPVYVGPEDSAYVPGDFDLAINGVWVGSESVSPDMGNGHVTVVRGAAHDTFSFQSKENIYLENVGFGFQEMDLGIYLYLPSGTFADTSLPLDGSFFSWPLYGYAVGVRFSDGEVLNSYFDFAPLRVWRDGEEQVVAVPTPAGVLGFGLTLLGLGALRSRRLPRP